MGNKEQIKELADEHWQYTNRVIILLLELTEVLYKEAMIHGYKHGQKADKDGK